LANGSKILVSSYVHLRKEGIESYIEDFNRMVKQVQGIVGRADIEVLPVVPVVREGLDRMGRELVSLLREWVDWIGVVSERESIRKLSGTGGRENDRECGEVTHIWKPRFQMRVKDPQTGQLGAVRLVEGDRTEMTVRAANVTYEMEKLRRGEKVGRKDESDGKKTTCEKSGVSLEGEFVFSRAVGEFLRTEVRDGTFRGNYLLNLKEQLRMRCMRENGVDRRVRVLLVGASQVGRLGAELMRLHEDKVRVVGVVRMGDEHTAERHAEILDEGAEMKEYVDVVVVGGPTNSLVRHGKDGMSGFGGERQVRVTKNKDGDDEWAVTYHMTDPVRITMTEKAELVERMVDMLVDAKRMVGNEVKVMHVTMFPRFVDRCCKDHMAEEDVWLFDGIRRDVNRETKDGVAESGYDIDIVDWWTLTGTRNEMTVNEIRRARIVDTDNVHLTNIANRNAASALLYRILEKKAGGGEKKRRME
jgi:hypothetical protein